MRHHTRECRPHAGIAFIGRHRGGRGFGRLVAGLAGGAGMGAQGFGAGRKLAAGDLQLVILALLAEAPRHGYEIIKALEERSGGFYSPSPGMVYPALTYLEELGHATVAAEGTKKLYRITGDGTRPSRGKSTLGAIDAGATRLDRPPHGAYAPGL